MLIVIKKLESRVTTLATEIKHSFWMCQVMHFTSSFRVLQPV